MSATFPNAIAIAGSGDSRLAPAHARTPGVGFHEPGFLTALRARMRDFWRKIHDGHGKPPSSGGGPDGPSEQPSSNSPWDDPALWMLMLH